MWLVTQITIKLHFHPQFSLHKHSASINEENCALLAESPIFTAIPLTFSPTMGELNEIKASKVGYCSRT